MRFAITQTGVDPRLLLEEAKTRLQDASPAFATIGAYLDELWARNITSGGFPALKPETVERKARRGQPATPLIGSGSLLNDRTVKAGKAWAYVRRGNRPWYAFLHNEGASISSHGATSNKGTAYAVAGYQLTKMEFVVFAPADEDFFEGTILDFVLGPEAEA